ncbi:MAG: diphthine--ammonia ligase [Thermomicrobia bacterium]|nr:diphthine--ammonia ligase [Thermomicrobia bacterium]
MERVVLLWSGGKDSALALYELRRAEEYEVAALLTTVTEEYDRVSMHGVRRSLLERQAASVGLPLTQVHIPRNCSNAEYASRMASACEELKGTGLHTAASGDIFLEDVRRYREGQLAEAGMRGVFPLWGRESAQLARTFVAAGFAAVTVCLDAQALDKEWAGRAYDTRFLADLPRGVDPCGENGEFHTFVYDGPIFRERLAWVRGDVVLRDDRFYYCDLLPW